MEKKDKIVEDLDIVEMQVITTFARDKDGDTYPIAGFPNEETELVLAKGSKGILKLWCEQDKYSDGSFVAEYCRLHLIDEDQNETN